MWLIEQPQVGFAYEQRSERGSSALSRRAAAGSQSLEATTEPELGEYGRDLCHVTTTGLHRETNVVLHGEVVVQEVGVAKHPNVAAEGSTVVGKVVAQDGRGAGGDGEESAEGPKQRGFSGTVWSLQDHDFAGEHVQVHAAERWEPVQGHHDLVERDHWRHVRGG